MPVSSIDEVVQLDPLVEVEAIWPEYAAAASLPFNTIGPAELPTDSSRHGWSFLDVSRRTIRAQSIVRMPDSRVVVAKGEWDLDYFAILTGRDRRVRDASRWAPGHRKVLSSRAIPDRRERAAWVLGSFHLNYYHWLIENIPRLELLRRLQLDDLIVVPQDFDPPQVWHDSAAAVGVDLASVSRLSGPILAANELVLVDSPLQHRNVLRQVRDVIVGNRRGDRHRRIFVSRRGETRRLVNESQVELLLARFGFEVVEFDRLTFEEQVSLSIEASIIVGVHGAGLANLLFAPPGSCLIEILDPGFAHPEYYDLASALGHSYGFLMATPMGKLEPGVRNLSVDVESLERLIVDALELR